YGLGDRVVLGTRQPAYRVTTKAGTDVTNLVNGTTGSYFVGEPGETLLVQLSPPSSSVPALSDTTPSGLDPFEIDPGDKYPSGDGTRETRTPTAASSQHMAVDEVILNSSGILIQ